MEEHVKVLEDEIIDLETLQEMTHDNLVSIGVKAFGQRHKTLNTSKNIVDTLLFSDATQNFSCKECKNIFTNKDMLRYHMETSHIATTEETLRRQFTVCGLALWVTCFGRRFF